MIKLQLSQHFCRDKNTVSRDTSFMSRWSDIMLWLLYIKKLQYMQFQFDYFRRIATNNTIFLLSSSIL